MDVSTGSRAADLTKNDKTVRVTERNAPAVEKSAVWMCVIENQYNSQKYQYSNIEICENLMN